MINKIRKEKDFELLVGMRFQYVDLSTNIAEPDIYTISALYDDNVEISWESSQGGDARAEYYKMHVLSYFKRGNWRVYRK